MIVGLDIGTTKICAVTGYAGADGEVEILGVGVAPSSGIKTGVVVDLDAATKGISDALERAHRMGGVGLESAYVGVTGQHISSQNGHGVVAVMDPSRIGEEDVERVLEHAGLIALPPERKIIHSIPRDYSVDGMSGVKSPVGMSGARLEVDVHIITGTSNFLSNVEKCVLAAGIEIDETVLEPLATSEACVTQPEKDLGVVLIDIGGGTTDVAVFVNGAIYHTAVVPIGGNHVTRDIAVGMRTSQTDAERLKLRFGCAVPRRVNEDEVVDVPSPGDREIRQLPRRVLAEIIEPRMQEIFSLAMQAVEDSGVADLLAAGVVLAGGGSLVEATVECAVQALGMPARIGYPQGITGLTDSVAGPEFGTGVGLVLYGANASARRAERAPSDMGGRLLRSVKRLLSRRR